MQVFISHSTANRELALKLTGELKRAGISTWNPDDQLLPGDNWAAEIGRALEASEVMVVLFARGDVDDENVRRDVQFAMTSGNYRSRIVPVLRDFTSFEIDADVPWVLLKLDPIYVEGASQDLTPIVQRIQSLIAAECNASD